MSERPMSNETVSNERLTLIAEGIAKRLDARVSGAPDLDRDIASAITELLTLRSKPVAGVEDLIERADAAALITTQKQEIERWKDTAAAEAEAFEEQKTLRHAAESRAKSLEEEVKRLRDKYEPETKTFEFKGQRYTASEVLEKGFYGQDLRTIKVARAALSGDKP